MNSEQKSKANVYVVDDEQTIAWTLSLILNQAGYNATPFYNPEILLRHAQKHAPEIVISDMVMPEMTGIQLALAFQDRLPACKFILFSGQAETSELLQRAEDQGHHFDVLTKPIHPSYLLLQLDSIVNDTEESLAQR